MTQYNTRTCDYIIGYKEGKPIYCSAATHKTIEGFVPNGKKYGIKHGTKLCKEHYEFVSDCCDTRGIVFSKNILRNLSKRSHLKYIAIPKKKPNKSDKKIFYYCDCESLELPYCLLITSGTVPRKDEIVTIRNIDYIVKEINYKLTYPGEPEIIDVTLEEIREISRD